MSNKEPYAMNNVLCIMELYVYNTEAKKDSFDIFSRGR